jgi:hypothetical protein
MGSVAELASPKVSNAMAMQEFDGLGRAGWTVKSPARLGNFVLITHRGIADYERPHTK